MKGFIASIIIIVFCLLFTYLIARFYPEQFVSMINQGISKIVSTVVNIVKGVSA